MLVCTVMQPPHMRLPVQVPAAPWREGVPEEAAALLPQEQATGGLSLSDLICPIAGIRWRMVHRNLCRWWKLPCCSKGAHQ